MHMARGAFYEAPALRQGARGKRTGEVYATQAGSCARVPGTCAAAPLIAVLAGCAHREAWSAVKEGDKRRRPQTRLHT